MQAKRSWPSIKIKSISMRDGKKILIGLFFLFILTAQGQAASPALSKDQPEYNVIFILIDALRADHVSSYGYQRKTNPDLDRLAESSILFENCISPAWYTLPSHASMFTSRYPHTHHVTEKNMRLPDKEITFAEIMKKNGYKTGGFVGGIFLEPSYGLNQGFETYYSSTLQLPHSFPFRLGKMQDTMPKAMEWIQENKDHKFFAFIHGYDLFMPAHLPEEYQDMYDPHYQGPAKKLLSMDRLHLRKTLRNTYFLGKRESQMLREITLNDSDIKHIIANYDAANYHGDSWIGKLLQKLEELNLAKKTIIIVTSDHGTDLLDHGTLHLYMDGGVYEELIHVPFLIRHPAIEGLNQRIQTQVNLIDIMPTILDALNIPLNKEAEGKSLMPLMLGKQAKDFNDYVFSGWDKFQTVRTNRWKLIYSNNSYMLYDLKEDPQEQKNLAEENPAIFNELLKQLFLWSLQSKPFDHTNQTKLSQELIKKLEKAGYW